MKYKKILLMITLIPTLISPAFGAEVLIFAGSGMRLPLEELGRNFTAETGIKVFYDFDGSGRLGSKILAGITPDIFVPGSNKWAARLMAEGYIQKCLPVAYHIPVIITPKGRHQVKSLKDLTNKNYKLALGDTKTSAIGQNNQRLFKKIGVRSADMNVVARGIAVKQLVQWVEAGAVDAAIVWRADAIQSRRVEMVELPQDLALEESIPLCRMKAPPHPEDRTRFWTYLLKNGPQMFAEYGFQMI